ncbi:DUF262 domain-containing protein [Corallococcus interemptor]|uniref:DUF262 domain-containing protein n=1 Tax=Corallococcus interemptor TaxID=2316720 RepID=UPI003D0665DA
MGLEEEIKQGRKTVVTDGYDMSFGEIINLYKLGELIINPPFQRLYRWKIHQKTRFIESLLLGLPIPPIFVYASGSTWELIDGLQRVSTILEFTGLLTTGDNITEQPLRLEGTKLLPSLKGRAWQETAAGISDGLSIDQQFDIKRTRIRVEILKRESDENAKFELFQRLNTGGSHLSEQEIRDCVMIMIDKTFYDWVKSLAALPTFSSTAKLTDRDSEQQKPTELCLRLLAYLRIPYSGEFDVHEYLDDAAVKMAKDPTLNRAEVATTFSDTFSFLKEALGEESFRKWDGTRFLGAFSISAFDAIAYGIAKNIDHLRTMPVQSRVSFIQQRTKQIWSDAVFVRNSGAGVRGTTRLANLLPHAPTYFSP